MIKPTTIKSLILIAAAGLLTACEPPRLTNANLREVKPGMKTKEVESILGPAHEAEFTHSSHGPSQTEYIYEQDGRKVRLTFEDDRLLPNGVSGSFER